MKCIDETGDDDDDSLVANKIRTSGRRPDGGMIMMRTAANTQYASHEKVRSKLPSYIHSDDEKLVE